MADTWCAAFVWKKDTSDLGKHCPTERDFRAVENNPHSILPHVKAEVRRLAEQYQFFHWHLAFPDVFRLPEEGQTAENEQTGWNGGFDVVLGNPPWERIKIQEKEWFAEKVPEIANALNAAARRRMITALKENDPALYAAFRYDLRRAEGQGRLIRDSDRYPLCGRGDVNTYQIFAELNRSLIGLKGRVGCIVPSGIATDNTTRFFFQDLMETRALVSLYALENKGRIFPAIKTSLRFCLLTLTNPSDRSKHVPDFVFYARTPQDLQDDDRHFTLSAEELELLNPNTLTCPIFRNKRDAELTKTVYRRVPVLIREARDNEAEQNPWNLRFMRMFDMANDSHLFRTRQQLEEDGWSHDGNIFRNGTAACLPLYEAKMVGHYDHRALTYERAQTRKLQSAEKSDPILCVLPRYWVEADQVDHRLEDKWERHWLIGFQDVTDVNTMARSVIASILPRTAVGHKLPLLLAEVARPTDCAGLKANLASFPLDYVGRQKIGGTSLAYFYLKQFPILPPTIYQEQTGLSTCQLSTIWWVAHVLELTYTAWDLDRFAKDCGYDGPPFRWDEQRRFLLRCELDAAYFHLYLGPAEEWAAGSPQLAEMFPTPRHAVEYIMETFPIVRRKDIARTEVKNEAGQIVQEGRYITKDTILEIYDEMAEAIRTGRPYQTRLTPPPGPPTNAEGNFIPYAEWTDEIRERYADVIHPPRETAPPLRIVAEVGFPGTQLERLQCACVLDLVWLQPGLSDDEYVDRAILAMQADRCRKLLMGNDRAGFDRARKVVPPELIAQPDGTPPWRMILTCLLANQSLVQSAGNLAPGDGFEKFREQLPAVPDEFVGLVGVAAERLRELQEAAVPAAAEAVQAAQEISQQHASVIEG